MISKVICRKYCLYNITIQQSISDTKMSLLGRWVDKVAIVTGASAGIGEAIAIKLIEHGLKVQYLIFALGKFKKYIFYSNLLFQYFSFNITIYLHGFDILIN